MNPGGLQLEEDLRFQRRFWVVQRAGWGAMAGAIALALTGIFGGGTARKVVRADDGSLSVEFRRIERHEAPTKLRITIGAGVAKAGAADIYLGEKFFEVYRVESVSPEPILVSAAGDGLIYRFHVNDAARPSKFTFHLNADGAGKFIAALGVPGHPSIELEQRILP